MRFATLSSLPFKCKRSGCLGTVPSTSTLNKMNTKSYLNQNNLLYLYIKQCNHQNMKLKDYHILKKQLIQSTQSVSVDLSTLKANVHHGRVCCNKFLPRGFSRSAWTSSSALWLSFPAYQLPASVSSMEMSTGRLKENRTFRGLNSNQHNAPMLQTLQCTNRSVASLEAHWRISWTLLRRNNIA